MKLSIIIPYYNTLPKYTDELLSILDPQMRPGVECILVDDGSEVPYEPKYDWCRYIYQKNGGTAVARNTGIDKTTGEYISFIDSDDTVAEYFVDKILDAIKKEHPDYIEMSWKTLPGGQQFAQKLTNCHSHLTNPSVCHRVFKRSFIGDFRFNPSKISGEDEEFSRKIGYERGKHHAITDYMCFYRTAVPNSKSKRFIRGETGTKIIVYYYPVITKDMTWLVEEAKKEDVSNQVFVLADKCELMDELKQHARVYCPPKQTRGHELRGEYTRFFTQLEYPIRADIVLYASKVGEVSGIGTFMRNFCVRMHNRYKIAVLYDTMDKNQIERLKPFATVAKNSPQKDVSCKNLIMNSVYDRIPGNIKRDQCIQLVHGCADIAGTRMPMDRDRYVFVSETVKKSWNMEGEVIKNMVLPQAAKSPLFLVTASRFDTHEKGQKRMVKLANLMNEKGIPFVWFYFSKETLNGAPYNLIKMAPTMDVIGYIRKADFLVQLSDTEGFGYSIVEALSEGIPVITTDLPVLKEIGVNEKNAHIVPFDIPDDFDVEKIFTERKRGFRYTFDNDTPAKNWDKVFSTIPEKEYVTVEIIKTYNDLQLGRDVKKGEVLEMEKKRAYQVQGVGCCKIV